jgi:hypothetical protein
MSLSVLGITACRLQSNQAIATALEGSRPTTVARLRQHYTARAWMPPRGPPG